MSSTAPVASNGADRVRGRRFVIALLAACIAPIVVSALVMRFWTPERRMNYGDLIAPSPLPDLTLQGIGGGELRLAGLRGRWILLHVDESACALPCRTALERMRDVRHAQGRDRHRIERIWLIADDGPVDEALRRDHPDLGIARLGGQRVLPAGEISPRDHIYVVDPLGNVMLRYPREADRIRMHRDLQRLLKVSRIG